MGAAGPRREPTLRRVLNVGSCLRDLAEPQSLPTSEAESEWESGVTRFAESLVSEIGVLLCSFFSFKVLLLGSRSRDLRQTPKRPGGARYR